MCHSFLGGGFGMFGIMGIASGTLQLAVLSLIAAAAVYAS